MSRFDESLAPKHTLTIPWLKFSEYEIQAILKMHYEATGFRVQWPHDEDASHERGIDLDCTGASGERVIIAVKKDPKTEDIVQLQRFARNDASQKIYVRIKRGTQEFEDETQRQGTVEFWDQSRLQLTLSESCLTQLLLFENSDFVKELLSIVWELIRLASSEVSGPQEKIRYGNAPELVDVLWALKDRSVTLRKCSYLLQMLNEDTKFSVPQQEYAREVLEVIVDVLCTGTKPFLEILRQKGKIVYLLRELYQITAGRSNWTMMMSYLPSLRPGLLAKHIKETASKPELTGPASKEGLCEYLKDMWRIIGIVSFGIEATVDDMREKYFQESQTRTKHRIRKVRLS